MGVGRERENLSLYISLERERKRSRENTLRTRVHAHARGERKEAGQRHGRDAKHETRVTGGVGSSSGGALGMHMKCTDESLLKNY